MRNSAASLSAQTAERGEKWILKQVQDDVDGCWAAMRYIFTNHTACAMFRAAIAR
jgi:hypothetical protein